jgi:hypothetical protein
MLKTLLAILLIAAFAVPALADPPVLVDPDTGQYLGTLSSNPYDSDSVNNPYGQYGSRYSATSVNNPYGEYGSRYSNKSAHNPYATDAPAIVDPDTGQYLGRYSSDPYAPDSVSNPYGRYGSQYSSDSINNPYGQYGNPYSPDSVNNPYASARHSYRRFVPPAKAGRTRHKRRVATPSRGDRDRSVAPAKPHSVGSRWKPVSQSLRDNAKQERPEAPASDNLFSDLPDVD